MPPVLISGSAEARDRLVSVGSVVVVAKQLRDKETKKPFMWRFFGLVIQRKKHAIKVIRFGAPEGSNDEFELSLYEREPNTIHLLPEDEWPDGVYVFRTRLILEGRVDEAV